MYKSDCDYIIIIIQNLYKIPHESRKDVNKTDDYAVKYILCRRGGGGVAGESMGCYLYKQYHTPTTFHIPYAFRYIKPIISITQNSYFITQNLV